MSTSMMTTQWPSHRSRRGRGSQSRLTARTSSLGQRTEENPRVSRTTSTSRPSFLKRPLGVGVAGVVAAAVIVVPLVMLGSGSGSGQGQDGQNQAADSSTATDTTPPTPLRTHTELLPLPQPITIPLPLTVTLPLALPIRIRIRHPKPKPKPKPKTTAKAKATAKAKSKAKAKAKTTPKKAAPKATRTPAIPTGRVLLKNKKYGFCLDLPGEGSVGVDTRVQDYDCKPTGDNQDFTLDLASKGTGTAGANLYLIRNVSSNLCLDLPNYRHRPATTPVSVYHCRPGREARQPALVVRQTPQRHVLGPQPEERRHVPRRGPHQQTAVTARVTVVQCNARDDHEWSFPKS